MLNRSSLNKRRDRSSPPGSDERSDAEATGAARKHAERKEAQRQAAKLARQQAYQKAKERRATDPRYLELKEAAKARRREHYERFKQHRKAAQLAQRAARSVQRAQVESAERSFFRQRRVINPKSQEAKELLQGPPAPASELGGAVISSPVGMGELLAASADVANDVS